MIVKNDDVDPPFVQAQLVESEPEINLGEPAKSSMVGAPTSAPAPTNPSSAPAGTTTTTTTYIQAPPKPAGNAPQGGFKFDSCATNCPNCHQHTNTRVTSRIDGCTITAVIVLLLFFWPLFWLPLVLPGCQTTEHYCSNCNYRIARNQSCQDGCC